MKDNKFVTCLFSVIVIFLIFVCTLLISGKIKVSNNSKITNYSGTFENDNYDKITITKDNNNYNVVINIYRLYVFGGNVDKIKNDILYINSTDGSGNPIKFEFNYKTKVLVVKETTWGLLNNNDKFEFNK